MRSGLFENYRDETARNGRFGSRRLQQSVKISLATSYIGTCRLLADSYPRNSEFRLKAANHALEIVMLVLALIPYTIIIPRVDFAAPGYYFPVDPKHVGENDWPFANFNR